MFPVLFEIGGFQVTSFGVLMALAFFSAGWILSAELRRKGQDPDVAWDLVWWGALGGILGAKVYYMLLTWRYTVADPWGAITSRAGLVWYGGFIAASLLILVQLRRKKLPILRFADAVAPALAMGYVVGRIGCFFVGDDYGRPTDLPWGIAFPRGAPPSTAGNLRDAFGVPVPPGVADDAVLAVHPTQLYEVGITLVIFAILWRLRKRPWAPGTLWFAYLAMAGAERWFVEIFRAKDDRFFGVLSLAQIISLIVVAIGIYGFLRLRRRPADAQAPARARVASA